MRPNESETRPSLGLFQKDIGIESESERMKQTRRKHAGSEKASYQVCFILMTGWINKIYLPPSVKYIHYK